MPYHIAGDNVQLSGVTIATLSTNAQRGEGSRPLTFNFNINATREIVEQLVRSLTFRTVGGTSILQRTVSFTLRDGDGGVNSSSTLINFS